MTKTRPPSKRKHDVLRLLRKDNLDPEMESQLKEELKLIEDQLVVVRRNELIERNLNIFKKIRHFERTKAARQLKRAEKHLNSLPLRCQ
ncbi:hypothetical protein GEMRC1_008079 [Eukaryota sp. GEM-RC1]